MKRISPVQYLIIAGAITILGCIGIAFLNWFVDPLQFYRRANYPPLFSNQSRFVYPGLAKHYPYEALILGTSVSRGFDLNYTEKVLGLKPMNFAMSGASAHEQFLLLQIALEHRKVKRVLWDVNYEFLRGRADWVSDFDGSFPAYLYDKNPWNEIPNYLLNLDTTQDSLRILLRRTGVKTYQSMKVEELSAANENVAHGFDRVRQAFENALQSHQFIFETHPEEFKPELLRRSFEANYLPILRSHPEVQFDLFFPPFSVAYHALIRHVASSAFEDEFRFKEYVVNATSSLPNVRVHDFQGIPEVILDLNRYVDSVHFDRKTHNLIIDSIAQGILLATPENLQRTETLLRAEATADWMDHLRAR